MLSFPKLALISAVTFLGACGTVQNLTGGSSSQPAATPAPAAAAPAASAPAASSDSQTVKSRDGSYEGEIKGKARPGSKFTGLKIGMDMQEVQTALGRSPDRLHTYESGKRWIPFYFGNDARRMFVLYKGEGCLTFTGGGVFGGSGGDLIGIHHDASGACYQP
ncbi:hypothetical protein [Hydrogenophaga sp. BPS33]|uniref:hypothetical protein n=1 Tax=Hydrogenophaga sp. BPS33 TaxID=2651974 RepID=UPI00131F9D57|nr:hypothetical protein [Hydrogenophaga sp. BPS33]QHE88455.1 hypothetical protein F9K07_28030 [Hydrogenophaga sp. BPS33]